MLGALVALTLTACGGSTTTTVTSAPAAGTSSTPSTPSTGSAGATATTAPNTATSGTPACVASMLSLSYLGGQGATGHGELGFALRNHGGAACHTFGYPGVLFLGKSGKALPTNSTRTTHDFFGTAPATRLLIAPGESVSFRIGVTHGINSTAGCATAYALQVIPPDDTVMLSTPIPNGAFECRTATVSPLRPGTTAYP
jgi:hypothetical protein